ncbi:hypothetical protein ABZX95_06275 [Streptomyces sp. NPDC004232]|uniref:hypothetical protein n=1 Tax=Streptomyces sp. NPDC004232 TaxID=3154454 RepID=UPI0033B58349
MLLRLSPALHPGLFQRRVDAVDRQREIASQVGVRGLNKGIGQRIPRLLDLLAQVVVQRQAVCRKVRAVTGAKEGTAQVSPELRKVGTDAVVKRHPQVAVAHCDAEVDDAEGEPCPGRPDGGIGHCGDSTS